MINSPHPPARRGLRRRADSVEPLIDDLAIDAHWRGDFEYNNGRHAAVTTAGMAALAPVIEKGLRSSLPTFQLGEMGTGEHLLAAAARVGEADYLHALRLFVAEEQEHARLLALVCHQLNIEMLETHWTDRVFQVSRTLAGLRAEVLMLLVAEFVAFRYYRILADGVGDDVLSGIFERIHQDEVRHIDFHAATLPRHLQRWPGPVRLLARAVWLVALVGSSAVVAWDHRHVLRACNSGSLRFFREMLGVIRTAEKRFFGTEVDAV